MNRTACLLCAVAFAVLLSGCSNLIESEQRLVKNARVTVSGTSPVPMLLITSTNFTATRNLEAGGLNVNYILADTAAITLPYDRSYSFGESDRFVVKLVNGDRDSTASVEMRVYLDGEENYRQAAIMKDSSLEFVFYQPISF